VGKTDGNKSENSAVQILTEALANISNRRNELLRELAELDASLRSYGMDPRRVAGTSYSQDANSAPSPSPADFPENSKRQRRPSPSVDWIVNQLTDGEKSQPELARRASESGFSNTGVVAVLKKHADQFTWERAPRSQSQRGMAPIIWSLRS